MLTRKRGKKACKGENKHVIKQASKRGCPRRTNVGLDLVFVSPLDWSTDDMRPSSKVPKRDSGSHVQRQE